MEIKIGETIRTLRQQRNINQEALAEALSVSIQAVSKWETGASLPDVALIPAIAEFFGAAIDQLFYGLDSRAAANAVGTSAAGANAVGANAVGTNAAGTAEASCRGSGEADLPFPNDNKIRIVQYIGHRLVKAADKDLWDGILVNLEETMENIPRDNSFFGKLQQMIKLNNIQIEVWGNAQLEGDLAGDLHAGGSAECGEVGGDAHAGGSLTCGEVGGDVHAGGSIECGEVGGDAHAGGSIECGEVGGDARVGGSLTCSEIGGDVTVGGNAQVNGEIGGDLNANGGVTCGDVSGDVRARAGNVECGNVDGDVIAQSVTCGDVGGDVQAKTVTHIHQ